MKYTDRRSIWFKAIAAAVLCLFLANSISWAYPNTLSAPAGDPEVYQEMREEMREKFDAHQGDIDTAIAGREKNPPSWPELQYHMHILDSSADNGTKQTALGAIWEGLSSRPMVDRRTTITALLKHYRAEQDAILKRGFFKVIIKLGMMYGDVAKEFLRVFDEGDIGMLTLMMQCYTIFLDININFPAAERVVSEIKDLIFDEDFRKIRESLFFFTDNTNYPNKNAMVCALLKNRTMLDRLEILSKHDDRRIRDHANKLLQFLSTGAIEVMGDATISGLAEDLFTAYESDGPLIVTLDAHELGQIFRHIKNAGMEPFQFLAKLLGEDRKRIVFLGLDKRKMDIFGDIEKLIAGDYLTHIALPFPESERDLFERFIKKEISAEEWPYHPLDGSELDHPDDKKDYIDKVALLQDKLFILNNSGKVEFILYGQESADENLGELGLDARIIPIKEIMRSDMNARILVLDHSMNISKDNLINDDGMPEISSMARHLVENTNIKKHEVACVFETDEDNLGIDHVYGMHNLVRLFDMFPVTSSFAVEIAGTSLEKMPWCLEYLNTCGTSWDAVIVRIDGGSDGGFFNKTPEIPGSKALLPEDATAPVNARALSLAGNWFDDQPSAKSLADKLFRDSPELKPLYDKVIEAALGGAVIDGIKKVSVSSIIADLKTQDSAVQKNAMSELTEIYQIGGNEGRENIVKHGEELIDALLELLKEEDVDIRGKASWVLSIVEHPHIEQAIQPLKKLWEKDRSHYVRTNAGITLRNIELSLPRIKRRAELASKRVDSADTSQTLLDKLKARVVNKTGLQGEDLFIEQSSPNGVDLGSIGILNMKKGELIAQVGYFLENRQSMHDADQMHQTLVVPGFITLPDYAGAGVMTLLYAYLCILHNTPQIYLMGAGSDSLKFFNALKEKGYVESIKSHDFDLLATVNLNRFESLLSGDPNKGNIANAIKDMHKLTAPTTRKELEEMRHMGPTTIDVELRMLRELGLRVTDKKDKFYKYGLHPMLRGLTGEQIEFLCDNVKIEVKGKRVKILERATIPDDLIPQVQAEIIKVIQNIIHDENRKITPLMHIPEGKTLCHVFVNELIPFEQQSGSFIRNINRMSEEAKGPERIKILNGREKLGEVIAELQQNSNNIVHVVVNSEDRLAQVPKGINSAILRGKLGNYIHFSGALAVSRALAIKDRAARNSKLHYLYRLLTGEPFRGTIPDEDDPRALALAIIFNLPKIEVSTKQLIELNKNLIFLIRHA